MDVSRDEHSHDVHLARQIVAGSLDAWHGFVKDYSSLIYAIARRYLVDFDEETRRDAYVAILEYMYSHGLAKYDGRAAMSTWVMTIARSRALDIRRAARGRKRDPAWLAGLQPRDREIYHLYFESGEDTATIRSRFARRGEQLTMADLSGSLDRLEAQMDRRLRTRLAYDLYARSLGTVSGSLLGFLDHLRLEQAAAAEASRPDIQLMERQTRLLLDQVRSAVENLGPDERKVVELHFYRSLAAPQIASTMGLPGARRVYTLLDRALVALRGAVHSPPRRAPRPAAKKVRQKRRKS